MSKHIKYRQNDVYFEPERKERDHYAIVNEILNEIAEKYLDTDSFKWGTSFGINNIRVHSEGAADPSEWDDIINELIDNLRQAGYHYERTIQGRKNFEVSLISLTDKDYEKYQHVAEPSLWHGNPPYGYGTNDYEDNPVMHSLEEDKKWLKLIINASLANKMTRRDARANIADLIDKWTMKADTTKELNFINTCLTAADLLGFKKM